MVSTDPISDMLSRIRNAALVNKSQARMPYSKVKEDVAKVLVTSGFLSGAKAEEVDGRKMLVIDISEDGQPAKMSFIQRKSRPGQRFYVQAKEIPKVKRGRGMVVISTSKGIMSGSEAAKQNLGGELICEVY